MSEPNSIVRRKNVELEQENAALRAKLALAEEALLDARDSIAEWGAYAGDYFQEKWDLKGAIARTEQALAVIREEKP